ncbi:membrane protein [Streptomyces sp. AS58]|uniref:lysylphosphatidylglycerol synthase domain-containing protein n=1 Tax=Streptomyces sp. AS58 TaxID=1519489 RepID=UPI0006AE87A2|nr:lysylphosphatidylglycerol synthase domain-containing protein [Streptomyces sp. AS58]KOV72066.1 membrane protein [Streptomyces sp. AS58]
MTDGVRVTRTGPPRPGPSGTPSARVRACWPVLLTLAVLVVAVVLARRHWPVLETGAGRLAVADHPWLLAAAAAVVTTWLCSALAQQGAVAQPLPAGRLVAAQFAASAANHVLPAGLGAGAVNLRFLMRCGLPAARSLTALAVKTAAGGIVRGTLIVVLALACPGLLHLPQVPGAYVAGGLAAVCLAAVPTARLWPRCRSAAARVTADIRAVHALPRRAAALWGGSLAFAALHALVVIAVAQAVGLSLPPVRVALVYLAASTAAALLPTPGGLGSLDAALALALTVAGAPGAAAASVVLGYRLLTVWLPLLPGLLVLAVLVRRRAL